MSLERRIDLQLAGLTVLSGVLFGLGEFQPTMPLGLLLAAFLATRRRGGQPRFWLPAPAVNGLIFVIALATAWRYLYEYGTAETIIIGHALGGLQAVLLFERKTARTFWDLLSLSLLTVFLSTALVQGPSFALGLAAYVFLAFSTLALICVERQRLHHAWGDGDAIAAATAGDVRGSWWRLLGIAVSTFLVGPMALFLRFPEREGQAGLRHEPGRAGKENAGYGVFHEPARWQTDETDVSAPAVLNREFWGRMVRMTGAVFAMAVVVFCVTPRFGRVEFELPPFRDIAWGASGASPRRVVGFTDRVRLGEIGSLAEDQRMVLELALVDGSGQQPYQAQGSVYLRGAALNQYRMGNWNHAQSDAMGGLRRLDTRRSADTGFLVRQRITMEPSDRREVFCVWPFLLLDDELPVRFDSRTERLWRRRDVVGRSFTFELATPAFRDGSQAALTPCDQPIDRAIHLDWPEYALPELARLAQRWLDASPIPENDPVGRARWLQRRFLDSGQFRYAFHETRRSSLSDPMEGFVTEHREGNCEYFASALALMLRSQGIPARLIVGFKTDEFNALRQAYRVRQSHAHAWVEAYIPVDQLPDGEIRPDGGFDWSHGAWLRLDPTPALPAAPEGMARHVGNWLGLLHSFWRDHVVSMTGARQREALYRPLVLQIRQVGASLSGSEVAGDVGPVVRWGFWLVAAAFFCGAAAVGLWLFGAPPVAWRFGIRPTRVAGRDTAAVNAPAAVAFYARWEAILARCGQVRLPSQTQREFAAQAAHTLVAACGDHRLFEWAGQIIQAFYTIRFGPGQLEDNQAALVETALAEFEQAACAPRPRPSPPDLDTDA